MKGERRWFAVGTQPGRETVAATHLQRQGFTCFLPMHVRTVRHAGRLSTQRGAFFPGYLFVALDLRTDRWRAVNGTVGVRHIVSAADRPVPIARGFVEKLQSTVDASGVIRLDIRRQKGDKLTLQYGPFAGMVGEWDRMEGAQRVRVLLNFLNGPVSVVVEAGSLL